MKTGTLFLCTLLLAACGKIVPDGDHKPGTPFSPLDDSPFDPGVMPANPNCVNPFPTDAWAGLDKQRISAQEFINGTNGSYFAYMVDMHVATLPAGDVAKAAHLRIYFTDRSNRNGTTQIQVLCSKNVTEPFDAQFVGIDALTRSDGSFSTLWTVGFHVKGSGFEFINSLFTLPQAQKVSDRTPPEGTQEMFFKRSPSRFEWRLKEAQSDREIYSSVTYLLK